MTDAKCGAGNAHSFRNTWFHYGKFMISPFQLPNDSYMYIYSIVITNNESYRTYQLPKTKAPNWLRRGQTSSTISLLVQYANIAITICSSCEPYKLPITKTGQIDLKGITWFKPNITNTVQHVNHHIVIDYLSCVMSFMYTQCDEAICYNNTQCDEAICHNNTHGK